MEPVKDKKPSRSPNLEGLRVRRLREDEGSSYVDLFRSGGDDAMNVSAFQWQFLDLPESPLWITVAEPLDEDKRTKSALGAIYCVAPRRFWVDGDQVQGSLSLQTYTGEDYRKRGLFIHLARTCYDQATGEGMAFVYGSPNDNSMPGFLKHLSWVRFPNPKVWACVKPIAHLRGMFGARVSPTKAKRWKVRELKDDCQPLDDLWQSFSKLVRIGAVRDAAFWKWRYLDQPGSTDRVFVMEDAHERALASCAVGFTGKREGCRGYILDFMYDPDYTEAGRALLELCTNILSSEGCRLVVTSVSAGNPYRELLQSTGFWPIPKRVHPAGPRLAVAVMSSQHDYLIERADDWHVTHGDYDAL